MGLHIIRGMVGTTALVVGRRPQAVATVNDAGITEYRVGLNVLFEYQPEWEVCRRVGGPPIRDRVSLPSVEGVTAGTARGTAGTLTPAHSLILPGLPSDIVPRATVSTDLGALIVGDCLPLLREIPDDTFDLVITSPPYDGQPKYRNGERYEREWYATFFRQVTAEILRTLKPHGSFVLNYRSKRHGDERGTMQYELVFWLREQGFLFAEDFVWGKPSPPPGRFNRFLKDAVEYVFQFTKTPRWQFYPENALSPARWDARDRERRKRFAHNYIRVNEPSGQGRKRVQAGPDWVRPSTLLHFEPEFAPNPTLHPARFPLALPAFFVKLLTQPGQLVFDPFAGTGTTGVAAEGLRRHWLLVEIDPSFVTALPERIRAGR